jgi:hypothetical protein
MFTGYILYLVVRVVAVTAIFYLYIEGVAGKVYQGLTNCVAWGATPSLTWESPAP